MQVEHEPQQHRFVVRLPEGEGELIYEQVGTDVLDLQHTRVQPSLKGRGVGDVLVRHVMDYARGRKMKIVPTCPYVQHWLKSHPEMQDLVTTRH